MTRPYWTNRLARPEDTSAILDLVGRVYADRAGLTRDYWLWRYLNDTPFRAETIMAEHQGQPIGIQPVAIFDYQWGEARLKGAMYTGVLTHPDHRRRGVFRSLIDSTNEHAARRGAQFSLTLPNDASLPGFLRFRDWEYPGLVPLYFKVMDGAAVLRPTLGRVMGALLGPWPRLFFRVRGDRGGQTTFDCSPTAFVSEELEEVFEAFARACGTLMLRRSAAYWNWRYASKPTSTYRTLVARQDGRLVGVVVTTVQQRLGQDVGMVMDVVGAGGVPVFRELLRNAEKELTSRGVGLVTCQATSPLLRCALEKEGYWCPPSGWVPKRFHFVYRVTGVPGFPRQPRALADWHLTFGDSDNA